MNTFFTSDLHLSHYNIINLCNRPFVNAAEMQDVIIKNHNEVVQKNDIVYDLGDIFYRGRYNDLPDILASFNGSRYIMTGNHDKDLLKCLKNGLLDSLIRDKKIVFLGSSENHQNIIQNIVIDKQEIILSHYALRSWNKSFRGSWHLFGHSHGKLPMLYKSMDVGVDTNNFYPYSFQDINNIMDNIKEDFKEV